MRVLVDLDRGLAEGKITQEEHGRIAALASGQNSHLALNILLGFGVLAVGAGFLAIVPSAAMASVSGSVLSVIGLALILLRPEPFRVVGNILLVVGTAFLAGGILILTKGSSNAALGVAVLFAAASVLARNGLLAALAVLALSSALGARTGYMHAMYMIGVSEPLKTVVVFTGLATVLVAVSRRAPEHLSRLALIAARTSALLACLGFWVGSLWGERSGYLFPSRAGFAVLWAIALLVAAIWAWRANRRWPLVTAAAFAGIHFYTQWFERLGANPGSVLGAGFLTIGVGVALRSMLERMPVRPA